MIKKQKKYFNKFIHTLDLYHLFCKQEKPELIITYIYKHVYEFNSRNEIYTTYK